MYARELKRLLGFSEARGLLVVKQALTIDNLIALRTTWTEYCHVIRQAVFE
jgi:hypothetical protein